jgi:hypothetical protein
MKKNVLQFGIEVIKSLLVEIILNVMGIAIISQISYESYNWINILIFMLIISSLLYLIVRFVKQYQLSIKIYDIVFEYWTKVMIENHKSNSDFNENDKYQHLIDTMKDDLLKNKLSMISRKQFDKYLRKYFKNSDYNKGYTGTIL